MHCLSSFLLPILYSYSIFECGNVALLAFVLVFTLVIVFALIFPPAPLLIIVLVFGLVFVLFFVLVFVLIFGLVFVLVFIFVYVLVFVLVFDLVFVLVFPAAPLLLFVLDFVLVLPPSPLPLFVLVFPSAKGNKVRSIPHSSSSIFNGFRIFIPSSSSILALWLLQGRLTVVQNSRNLGYPNHTLPRAQAKRAVRSKSTSGRCK